MSVSVSCQVWIGTSILAYLGFSSLTLVLLGFFVLFASGDFWPVEVLGVLLASLPMENTWNPPPPKGKY